MPDADHQSVAARVAPRPARRRAAPVPAAAERARTLLEFASSVVLDVPGVDLTARPGIPPLVACTVLPDGTVAVLVDTDSPLHRIAAVAALSHDQRPLAELEAVDVAPVAVPHRIRGRAHVRGRLALAPADSRERIAAHFPRHSPTGRAVLHLHPDHLAVDDLWGSECCVDPALLAGAAPDPVAGQEAGLLQHLAAAHADQLYALGAQALAHPAAAGDLAAHELVGVRPVALDRHGLRVRLLGAGPDGPVLDARFEFHHPVTGPDDLPEAIHRLFTHRTG
ncbi:DUF2470 domain-containing protein [Kitasatospora terrestris]|uniref:DUF2470 domain-containing protein n=1 Tax=Kitasatospora terrestris TaxID=258051 RepID=A0ABP9DI99_9ACTN